MAATVMPLERRPRFSSREQPAADRARRSPLRRSRKGGRGDLVLLSWFLSWFDRGSDSGLTRGLTSGLRPEDHEPHRARHLPDLDSPAVLPGPDMALDRGVSQPGPVSHGRPLHEREELAAPQLAGEAMYVARRGNVRVLRERVESRDGAVGNAPRQHAPDGRARLPLGSLDSGGGDACRCRARRVRIHWWPTSPATPGQTSTARGKGRPRAARLYERVFLASLSFLGKRPVSHRVERPTGTPQRRANDPTETASPTPTGHSQHSAGPHPRSITAYVLV